MSDSYDQYKAGLASPAEHAFVATFHDSNELSNYTRAIYVMADGNASMVLVGEGESAETFEGLKAGTVYPFRVKQIRSTDTTVGTGKIIGLY